jgi:hypothetical protein
MPDDEDKTAYGPVLQGGHQSSHGSLVHAPNCDVKDLRPGYRHQYKSASKNMPIQSDMNLQLRARVCWALAGGAMAG